MDPTYSVMHTIYLSNLPLAVLPVAAVAATAAVVAVAIAAFVVIETTIIYHNMFTHRGGKITF